MSDKATEIVKRARQLIESKRDELGDDYQITVMAFERVVRGLGEAVASREFLMGLNAGLSAALNAMHFSSEVAGSGLESANAAVGSTISLYLLALAALIEAHGGGLEA